MVYEKYLICEEYEVPHMSKKSIIKTNIAPAERTLKNLPKNSKGKPKCHFQKWLGISKNGEKGYDNRYYGWSHRAIAGFGVGDKVDGDSMAHIDYKGMNSDKGIKHNSYTIKTEQEAKDHAIRFMKVVS